MNETTFKMTFVPESAHDAIINDEFPGFKEDYLALHCLLRRYSPHLKRFLEIGTNMGRGTKIIKNALHKAEVLTLDLPTELAHISLQHPILEGKGDSVGHLCDLPFTQLRGDSLTFDYSAHYPIDGWFIDGEHDEAHAYHESCEAIKSEAKLIVWHDADMEPVLAGIKKAFEGNKNYYLFRITDTRIAYAVRK